MISRLLIALCTFLFSVGALADVFNVSQKNIAFSQPLLLIKPGDAVEFSNDDSVIHNIVSVTPEHKFDLGRFEPGKKETKKFADAGVIDIECAIHPNMKMTLFVFERWQQRASADKHKH